MHVYAIQILIMRPRTSKCVPEPFSLEIALLIIEDSVEVRHDFPVAGHIQTHDLYSGNNSVAKYALGLRTSYLILRLIISCDTHFLRRPFLCHLHSDLTHSLCVDFGSHGDSANNSDHIHMT